MRFAAANSFSAADYASAGRAASNSLVNSFAAARRNAPDWTGLARTSMNTRSAERQTAMKAEADVATAGMRAFGNVKDVQIKGAYALEGRKTEIDSRKRMAGRLGALGGFKLPKPSNKKHYDNFINKLEGMKQQVPDGQGGFVDNTQAAAPPELVTKEQVLAEQAANNSAPTQQQPPTNPHTDGGSVDPSGIVRSTGPQLKPGQNITQAQGKALLMAQGMPEADARIGAAVMMAESRGNPQARSSAELEARTGEMSIGLWQHNKNTGEDRHKFYGISDWNELKDPQTNARATFRLWQRRGGWGDWGAYTNGSYQDYL